MANSNFVVQNGLTVGPTIIFAANGDVTTSGNISVTGAGTFGGLSSNKIYQGAANVTVTSSFVNVAIGSTNVASFSSTGLTVLGTTTTVNNETINGNFTPGGNVSYDTGSSSAWWRNAYIGNLQVAAVSVNGNPGTSGQYLSSTGTGLNWVTLSASSITNGTSNVTVAASGAITMGVAGANVVAFGSSGVVPAANIATNIGNTTNWFNIIYGNTFLGRSTSAQYADLAENYQADKAYMAGTVLMFGGSAEVTVADADTTAVAGVVSTNPAHLMNGGLTGTNVVPLALQGRVPCQVIGPVHKGDLMVSAGHGFAKVNNTPVTGTVIGKALQEVTFAGKAVIEVVVGRV